LLNAKIIQNAMMFSKIILDKIKNRRLVEFPVKEKNEDNSRYSYIKKIGQQGLNT